jgi:hypothetical protein
MSAKDERLHFVPFCVERLHPRSLEGLPRRRGLSRAQSPAGASAAASDRGAYASDASDAASSGEPASDGAPASDAAPASEALPASPPLDELELPASGIVWHTATMSPISVLAPVHVWPPVHSSDEAQSWTALLGHAAAHVAAIVVGFAQQSEPPSASQSAAFMHASGEVTPPLLELDEDDEPPPSPPPPGEPPPDDELLHAATSARANDATLRKATAGTVKRMAKSPAEEPDKGPTGARPYSEPARPCHRTILKKEGSAVAIRRAFPVGIAPDLGS